MPPQPLPPHWIDDAGWLLQAMDPHARLVRLIRMDEAAYRAASFLDDRMLKPGLQTMLCSFDEAMSDAERLTREDARWIFHIGHVGSTLVSRLLGELDGVLSLREPRSFRDLSVVGDGELAAVSRNLRRIFSRGFADDQLALIKTTSSVSEQAPQLVPAGGAALFLYATPRNYVAGILAGENSLKELAARHEQRVISLGERGIGAAGLDVSDAHRAAAAWACEMTSLEAAADVMADRKLLWADFDVMLDDVAGWLGRCARHFGFAASPERLTELAEGPLMRRYSKALEYDYSPSLRAELLDEATHWHRPQIDAAMAALAMLAESSPLLARALERAEQEH